MREGCLTFAGFIYLRFQSLEGFISIIKSTKFLLYFPLNSDFVKCHMYVSGVRDFKKKQMKML